MGASSKELVAAAASEWCAPTRELESAKLLELVHETRGLPEVGSKDFASDVPSPVEIARGSEVGSIPPPPFELEEAVVLEVERGAPVYPVLPDRLRPVRIALAMFAITAVAALCAMVVW